MLAPVIPLRPVIRQTRGETPLALSDILEDGVNLAVWERQLPLHRLSPAILELCADPAARSVA